jgi:hypothetical protein
MPNYIGLLILGVIIAFFIILFLVTYRRVEIGAAFAKERGWEFQDVLPQFGQAQRQRLFRGMSADGVSWEMIVNLKQSTSRAVPVASTIWSTDQIRSSSGIVLIGPTLDPSFEQFDLSNPIITMFFRMILGDDADQMSDLQRVLIPEQSTVNVLATNREYARAIVTAEVLDCYQKWLMTYKHEEYFPVLFLNRDHLQFKVQRALTKAADADAFVNLCLNVTSLVRNSMTGR